ncbi:MAG: hypothetical protein K6L75_02925 [Cellvibrionaceae bacterium]
MKTEPILESVFYHDGRGPELQKVIWGHNGVVLIGFEYFNPDDEYIEGNLKHIKLVGLEAFSMASEEVHGNILATGENSASIFEVKDSEWLASFNQAHLSECKHYQIMFYDEIYDVICKEVKSGAGKLNA